MFRRLRGLIDSSSLGDFGTLVFDIMSSRESDVCERFRAFWAAFRIPSLLKLAARCFMVAGDLRVSGFPEPFATEAMPTPGMSMVKLAWVGMEYLGAVAAVADLGESPVDDGDMVLVWRWS